MYRLLSIGLAAALSATPGVAATVVYSDASAFSSATGPATVIDFQGCTPRSSASVISSSSGPCAGIPSGATFMGDNFYVARAGQSSNSTIALGINTPLGGINTITFDSPVGFFGADLFQNFGRGSQSGSSANFLISLFGAGSAPLGTFTPLVAPNGGSFFGVTSTDAIFSVAVSQPSGYAVIDNVTFGTLAAAVPEPTTWGMMLLGFGSIGGMLRLAKRRKVRFFAHS